MKEDDTSTPDAEYWNAYWRAWDEASSQEEAGARDPAPLQHWAAHFRREFASADRTRLIDVACGHGPVTGVAVDAAKQAAVTLDAHCVDYSQSAVDELLRRYPGVNGIACNALQIPYGDRNFDHVVSQFGLEYAGFAAFTEAARLVADGGAFRALLHLSGGAIHAECAENLAITVTLREAGFMTLARAAFETGFERVAGRASDEDFLAADRRLAPAVESAKQLLLDKGPGVAGGLLARLYRDIGYMYRRIQNYVPAEVLAWLDGMSAELDSYEGRMASMTRAAVDDDGVRAIGEHLTTAGLAVEEPVTLSLAVSGNPAAWVVSARRPN